MANRRRCRFRTQAWIIAVLALVAAIDHASARVLVRDYVFEPLPGEELSLTQNSVSALVQDRQGFLWIATQGGLHRFDGHELRLWMHRPDVPGGLPDSLVTTLAEDDVDRLWVGTFSGGIARLRLADGAVESLHGLSGEGEAALAGDVSALYWQAGTGMWIGDDHGALLLPAGDLPAQRVTGIEPAASDGRRDILAFAQTVHGEILAGGRAGLFRFDDALGATAVAGFEDVVVSAMLTASDGRTWIGTHTGLRRLGPSGIEPVAGVAGTVAIHALVEDENGSIWAGTNRHGLLRIDADGETTQLRHDRYVPGSLPEDRIAALLVDRTGILWVGGMHRGVSRTPARGATFRYLADRAAADAPLLDNNVRALAESPDGTLWVGFDGEGLKRLPAGADRFEDVSPRVRSALGAAPTDPLRVQALAVAADGALWIATTAGLAQGDASGATMTAIAAEVLADRNLRSLLVGSDDSLWVGSLRGGLTRIWPDRRRVVSYRHHPADPSSLSHDAVLAIAEHPSGAIYVGTLGGLDRLDPGTGTVERMQHRAGDPVSLSGNQVRALFVDAGGALWVGTHAGLNRLEEPGAGSGRFTRFPLPAHFPDNTVFAILDDDQGRLWLSGNRGILAFDRERQTFRAFARKDGLQALEFNGGSALRRRDGRLLFGGIDGISEFDPGRIGAFTAPPVRITSIRVAADGRELVEGTAPAAIHLEASDRTVSVGFAALDLFAAERQRFAWRLVGFDESWNDGGRRREATYTNLPAGNYSLEIRTLGDDGAPRMDGASLAIEVAPPWWLSAPMQAAYAALAALFLLLLWRLARRRRQLREDYAAQLREREDRLKLALWGSGDEFWDWDVANNRFHRLGADQLLGFVETEQQMSSDDWRHRAVHQDDRERVERILAEHLAGRTDYFESEHRILAANQAWVWVRSRGKVVERDAEGRPLRICGTARNITDSRRAERERRVAAEVIRSMSEGVSVVDLAFRFVSVNPAFSRITGYDAEDVLGEDAGILNGPQHTLEEYRQMRQELERDGHWHGELWQRRKDGEDILCWLESTEVRDAADNRTHYVAVLTDITDRKRAEQELRYLANYDTLTGLPNRTLLGERLAHAVIRARRQTTKIGVLFLDLDRFKHVNDSMGHAMGDRLLKAAGARLRLTVRDTDTVARLGGDEFTVVLEDIHTVTQAERVAHKILEAFAEPLELDGRQDVVISPSIGIALYPDHGQVPTDLLKFADTAMYQAKDRGRNTYQVYAETMDAEARLRATMVGALRRALDRGEFRLVYQPKLSLLDDSFTGVEALLRWDSEELGPIPPTTFIPLAEETGLIIAIGEWVLREACTQLLKWTGDGLGHLTVAVNVSVLQLFRGELSERLREIVGEYGIAPDRLELELTESMVMAKAEQSINTLRSLKAIGVNLAIDDFGTGYSSLAYLKRLPIDTLKIDKEFVGDITTDPDDEAITATIIAMAHSLGLNVVAEGVETEEQLLYLREQRCDEVQGFWLSAPLEAERCTAFLLARHQAQQKRRRTVRT